MKQIFALLLVYVFLITNSCNNSKISLGRKHHHTPSEEVNVKESNPNSAQVVPEKTIDVPTIVKEKNTIEDVAIQQMDQVLDEKSSEKLHQNIDRVKTKIESKKNRKKNTKKKEKKERDAKALIFFGTILILAGAAAVFVAIKEIENNSGSAVGCLTSLFIGALIVLLGVVLGIVGLTLIITGITVFAKK